MTPPATELINAFETHSLEEIQGILDVGLDPRALIRGKSPVHWLTEMYTRSDRFPDCLRLLLDRGAVLDDPVIAPVIRWQWWCHRPDWQLARELRDG